MRIAVLLALCWVSRVAVADAPAEIRACLDANDVPCAQAVVVRDNARSSRDPALLAAAAQTAFHDGEYADAAAQMDRAVAAGWPDRWKEAPVYRSTAATMADWAQEVQGRHVVRYRPGVDAILVDDAVDVLERVEANVAPILGGNTPGRIIVELYPDGRSFTACSSLPPEAVTGNGVVGLSKWSRLLVTSPRALGRGYGWQDTIAHEYVHLIVSHQTGDKAPVWLQEGIAKYLDSRWPDGAEHHRLGVREQTLLASALREEADGPDEAKDLDDTVGLVTFKSMHPSLALLPNPAMATLAYAQLSMLVRFAFESGGDATIRATLDAVDAGTDPQLALATAAGFRTFEAFEKAWRVWLEGQALVSADRLPSALPTVLDGADESALDPVLAERADLLRWMRLGDLLAARGHAAAALVEYNRAVDPTEPVSPTLSNRVAEAKLALGDTRGATAALQESLADYPEFAESHRTLGRIHLAAGDKAAARQSFRRAAELDPFDLSVQQALIDIERAAGDAAAAQRHEAALRVLRRGGPDPDQITYLRPRAVEPSR